MEIEDLIKQDILCKKLLLSYCIEEMRDNLKDIDKTLPDFDDARQKNIVEGGFKNRIGTAKENITYLVNEKKICNRFKSEFINNIGDLEHEIIELVKEISDEFDAFRSKFVCRNADIEYYVKNIKDKYIQLIRTYKDFLIEEGKIKEEVIKIWMDELTNIESYIENDKFKLLVDKFKFLVYATEKNAESVKKDVLCDNGVIHTSYITDTHPYVYKNREYGLIFDINKETLLYMCKGDAETADFYINKEPLLYIYKGDAQKVDFKGSIDCIFSMNDFHCFRKKGILRVYNSGIDLCSTYLPGQLLGKTYNEVVLINNKYNMPKAVFVFDDAKEIWKNHAENLKEMLGLSLITIKRNKGNINL